MEINKKDKNKEYLKNMTETEKTFSYLNKYFIFKKVKETPPNLYKKLLSNLVNIEKKNKKKNQQNEVESVLNNNIEENIEFEEENGEIENNNN